MTPAITSTPPNRYSQYAKEFSPGERHVGRADLQGHDGVGKREHDRGGGRQQHDRAVHRLRHGVLRRIDGGCTLVVEGANMPTSPEAMQAHGLI
jgi:hypothetical protein